MAPWPRGARCLSCTSRPRHHTGCGPLSSNVRRHQLRHLLLSDLIAVKPEEAEAVLSTPGHANIWPTLEAKTVDQVKLASLAFLLQAKSLDDPNFTAYVQSFKPLATAGDDGPWIDQLPEQLVRDLASLEDSKIPSVAAAWATTEEARLDRWNAKDVTPFLKELAAFAATALAQGRAVVLWSCL